MAHQPAQAKWILTINGGSSSVKFALFDGGEHPSRVLWGKIERIGIDGTTLSFQHGAESGENNLGSLDFTAAGQALIEFLEKRVSFAAIAAIGHRIVHGGPKYSQPVIIDAQVLQELRRISPYDPEHLPAEIGMLELFGAHRPKHPQVACFDTAFHRNMPRVATILPIPRKYEALGVRRYGFHGLSYSYLMEELERRAGREAANGRVILAHLGSGCSLAAVHGGRGIDTSMGFTPAAGMPMGTRSGSLDPGVAGFLFREGHLTPQDYQHMVNHDSGLKGISETSSDMRDLLARAKDDVRAAEAVGVFCYEARKWIGAFAAALGGLDTLVFAGGIGEHGSEIRARICEGLQFLGVNLVETRNAASADVISRDGAPTAVRVIRTDEEIMIAKAVRLVVQAFSPPAR